MNILDKIVAQKKVEVIKKKSCFSLHSLKDEEFYHAPLRSLKSAVCDPGKTGIIAEFKRKSPSKGWFTQVESPVQIISGYDASGASGISVLTDTQFFGGSLNDLQIARRSVECPILRKDFILESYQLHESKAAGADVILLIAAILSPLVVKELAQEAKELQLEVLLEIHNQEELKHICEEVDLVGVNNRDLKTFLVDINESIKLGQLIPSNFIKISESGIDSVNTINLLKKNGFQGFLLGEKFMKEKDPARAFKEFAEELNKKNEN